MVHVLYHAYYCLSPQVIPPFLWLFRSQEPERTKYLQTKTLLGFGMLEVKTARKRVGLRNSWFVKHAKNTAVEHVVQRFGVDFSQGWHQQKMEIWRRFCRRYVTNLGIYFLGSVNMQVLYTFLVMLQVYTLITCSILKLMDLGLKPFHKKKIHAICAEGVRHCNISVCKMLIFLWTYSMRQSFGSIHQQQRHFPGKLPAAWQRPDVWWKPGGINVTSYWHILFIVSKIFWRLKRNSLLLVSPSMPKLFFLQQVTEKDLQPAKKNSEQLRKKAGFLGSLGRFGVSKHRACGFDMPTCTEWCLRGLQRRTLEARSCNYKPCWFIYLRVHYLRLLVTDM